MNIFGRYKSHKVTFGSKTVELGCGMSLTYTDPVTTLVDTKADDIARSLEDEIVSGLIAPGTVLRQEQLSERFDVAGRPCARRCAGSPRSGSCRSSRTAASASGRSRRRSCARPSSFGPSSRRSRPRWRRRR